MDKSIPMTSMLRAIFMDSKVIINLLDIADFLGELLLPTGSNILLLLILILFSSLADIWTLLASYKVSRQKTTTIR